MKRGVLLTITVALCCAEICAGAEPPKKGPKKLDPATVNQRLALPDDKDLRRARAWLSEIYSRELHQQNIDASIPVLLDAANKAKDDPAVVAASLCFAAEVSAKGGYQSSALNALHEFEKRFGLPQAEKGEVASSENDGENVQKVAASLLRRIRDKKPDSDELQNWVSVIKDNARRSGGDTPNQIIPRPPSGRP